MGLIDKIKAEVEKKTHGEQGYSLGDAECGYRDCARDILSFLDTLEVKEVDLDKEIKKYIENNICGYCVPGVEETAKYFFELGLKAQKRETELLKVKGFLVRDKDDYTAIYAEKPHRGKTEWVDGNDSCLMTINDARLVPDIEFEDEPVEVELTLKRLNAEG